MNRACQRWIAPLLAGWVLLWQAIAGFASVPAAASAEARPCCAAKPAKVHACCAATCCAAPADPARAPLPAVPAAPATQPSTDWAPALLPAFLAPTFGAQDSPAPGWADDASAAAPSEPLFRRHCALLI